MNVIDFLCTTRRQRASALARRTSAGSSLVVLLMQVVIVIGVHRRTQRQLIGKSIYVQRVITMQVKYLDKPSPAGSECRMEKSCHVLEVKMHAKSDPQGFPAHLLILKQFVV